MKKIANFVSRKHKTLCYQKFMKNHPHMNTKAIRRYLTLAVMTVILATGFTACSGDDSADAENLLKTVPSSASLVSLANVDELLKDAGCEVKDGKVTPSPEISAIISSISDAETRRVLQSLFSGDSGVNPDHAVVFTDSYRTYLTATLTDTDRFREYIESISSGKKFSEADGVSVCGQVAMKGGQMWMLVSSNSDIEPRTVLSYSTLSESRSFFSKPEAERILKSDSDITLWTDMGSITGSNPNLSIRDAAMATMLTSTVFEDASSVLAAIDFQKGHLTVETDVLNSKCAPSKFLLPLGKIDVATVQKLGGDAETLFAIYFSKELAKKIEGIAGSFGSAIPAEIIDIIKPVDGTVAVAVSTPGDFKGGARGIITLDGKPTPGLLNFLNQFAGTREEGKTLRFLTKDVYTGSLKVEKSAELFKGKSAGFVASASALGELGFRKDSPISMFSTISMMLEPKSGSQHLTFRLDGANSEENILLTILKAASNHNAGKSAPTTVPADSSAVKTPAADKPVPARTHSEKAPERDYPGRPL